MTSSAATKPTIVPMTRLSAAARVTLANIAPCHGGRILLRIYDSAPDPARSVRLRVNDGELHSIALPRSSDDVYSVPAWTQLDLALLAPTNTSPLSLVIESDQASSAQLWAFATVTKPDGSVAVHLPR